ncbi:MAG: hypothetical protein ACREQW_25335 [Candidatus Binatia bacterium]
MISQDPVTSLQPGREPKTPQNGGASDETKNALTGLSQQIALHIAPEEINGEKQRAKYKSVPEDWRAIPPGRFTNAIGHLEAVLLDITVDRAVTSNVFDWKPTMPTLQIWTDHLRAALKALTK